MLDTRKIEIFTTPQKLIDHTNPDLFERTFSPWAKDSVNFIVSDLLWDHVMKVVTNKDNFKKLCDTYKKLGMKPGRQILFMGQLRVTIMTEVLTQTTVRVACGAIREDGTYAFVCSADVELFPSDDAWYKSFNPIVSNLYKDLSTPQLTKFCQDILSRSISAYIFLTLIEVETVFVEPKEKFRPKKFEGFKNQQKVRLQIADLGWSRETILSLPFSVSGHLRSQPVGPGRQERKQLYIAPYLKSGYHRQSGKDRILK